MTHKINVRIYQSDGSDGYSSGTYGYIVDVYTDQLPITSTDGGFSCPEHASEKANEIAAWHSLNPLRIG